MEIPAFFLPPDPPPLSGLGIKSRRRGPLAIFQSQPRASYSVPVLNFGRRQRGDPMSRVTPTRAALLLLVCILTSEAFEIKDIAPGHKIAAQIGERLVLNCCTTGCASPEFSWRTEMDNPLGGTMTTEGPNSFLTVNSVGFANEHTYVCNAICGKEKREKKVKIDIYSFPSDPVIEISSPLVLGKPASIICHVHSVFPSEQLVLSLKKNDDLLPTGEPDPEPPSSSVQTKTVHFSFIPTKEDTGKELACIAELPIEEMEFEPKERKTTHVLNVIFGPLNTHITKMPGTTLSEGETLTLTCVTESHPPAEIVWKKQLADETVQLIQESHELIIPHTQFSNSGTYICEATNNVTKEVERKTISVFIRGPPAHLEFPIFPSTTVQEGESVSLQCLAKSSSPAHVFIKRKSLSGDVILESQGGFFNITQVAPADAGDYECQVTNEFGDAQMIRTLHVEYGPRNTTIVITPSNIVKEGDTVIMRCLTDGNPTPKVSWKKQLSNGESQPASEDDTLILKQVQAQDMGRYECEGLNRAGRDGKAVELVVEVFSPTTSPLTDAPETFTEIGDFTRKTTAYSPLHQQTDRQGHTENESPAAPEDMTFTTNIAMKNETVTYSVTSFASDKNGTEETEIIIARMTGPDYVAPIIIAVASLATAAGPVAAILIYISRKTKINGSYSLVNPLKAQV